ncbi:MAG: 1-acyl-sn-glycerol-3-phosphate acyltransferase, partial [Acidimicrobiales bacterium]
LYRSVEVGNPDPGWSRAPVIMVANHPTGMSDPALLLGLLGRSPRFLAKSTLWETRGVGWFLDRIGAIPVYRAQDGSTGKNAEMFRDVVDVLQHRETVTLFPQGRVFDEPYLGPIKTGAARIALSGHAAGVDGLQVVPVGIHLKEKAAIRSRAFVQVGEVLDLDAEVAEQDDAEASPEDVDLVHELTGEIEDRLARVSPSFVDRSRAEALSFAAEVALREPEASSGVSFAERELVAARLTRCDDAAQLEVVAPSQRYASALDENEVRDTDVLLAQHPDGLPKRLLGALVFLVLLAPFAAAGVVLNVVPTLILWGSTRLKSGSMTRSTVRLVVAIFAYLVMWVVWAVVAWRMWSGQIGLIVLAAGPLYGAVAVSVLDRAVPLWRDWSGWRRARRLGSAGDALRAERALVVDRVEQVLLR